MDRALAERRCLTCGGPAVICVESSRCVGLGVPGLRPPTIAERASSRTAATETSFGWQVRALMTFAIWAFGIVAGRRFTLTGRPMLVFVGVPYVVVALVLTRELWRSRTVRS